MYIPKLKKKYQGKIVGQLKKELGYKSIMAVPRLKKIVINIGIGKAVSNPKMLETKLQELTLIAGQKAIPTRAKNSISNFKLRKGDKIGTKVTLRKNRMYEFLQRLIDIALPRVRDFQGLPDNSFDKMGNYNIGIEEHIIFPEISLDKVDKITGMNIAFVTTNNDTKGSLALLKAFGMPLKNLINKINR